MGLIDKFLLDIRTQKTPFHKRLYQTAKVLRRTRLPFPRLLGGILFWIRNAGLVVWRGVKQIVFFDPMLRYRCKRVGKAVYFESTFPLIMGYGDIYIGDRVNISGNVNLIVSYKANPNPTIIIGDDVSLGFECTMSCADRITIGNRVLIAHFASIYDNNNHPIDPGARAKNMPIGKDDFAPVVIEDDVWIGAHAVVLKGVTIGRGSVVAMGSVVTKDVPPMTVVAGNPARVVKQIVPIGAEGGCDGTRTE
jgi:acetyltransferase-like isoleucine patch superfamily enzyme